MVGSDCGVDIVVSLHHLLSISPVADSEKKLWNLFT